MIKLTSLAVIRSSRFLLQSRNHISAWERKLHQSSGNGASPAKKSESTEFIGTAGLYTEEVFKCTEGVCGNASESEFSYFDTTAIFNQEEELIVLEDENDKILRFSDEDSTNEYESLRIITTGDVMHVAMKLLAKRGLSVTELRNMLSKRFPLDTIDEVIEAMENRHYPAMLVAELRNMLSKRFPLDTVDEVIEPMENQGYLNDGLYAESFSRTRFLHYIWGPELIKQALLLNGISEMQAENATRKVFQDNYDYHNNMLDVTTSKKTNGYNYDVEEEMSQSAMEYLFLQTSKQWSREKNICLDYRKVKMIRWLLNRGFSSGVTRAILRRLWSE